MKKTSILFVCLWQIALLSCGQNKTQESSKKFPVQKPEAQWKKELSEPEYKVLRLKGTERPYTGKYHKHKEKGVYVCNACNHPLFKSDTKFDSGTGWPSYYDALPGAVVIEKDNSHGMVRDEVLCANCGSHLGHVFDDGPKPTGLRYCMNSVSLDFVKK